MAIKGTKQSPEHVAKRVAAWRLSTAPIWTPERRAARSAAYKGRKLPEEVKRKLSIALKGKQNCLGHKQSEERRRAQAKYWAENREKHNHYIDGKGEERNGARQADMSRIEYRLWREKVFSRDNWTCVLCGEHGCRLHADHIKPYSQYPQLRYELTNGRTLCVPCHKKQPTWGSGAMRRLMS